MREPRVGGHTHRLAEPCILVIRPSLSSDQLGDDPHPDIARFGCLGPGPAPARPSRQVVGSLEADGRCELFPLLGGPTDMPAQRRRGRGRNPWPRSVRAAHAPEKEGAEDVLGPTCSLDGVLDVLEGGFQISGEMVTPISMEQECAEVAFPRWAIDVPFCGRAKRLRHLFDGAIEVIHPDRGLGFSSARCRSM
jgi:hypothetical protein